MVPSLVSSVQQLLVQKIQDRGRREVITGHLFIHIVIKVVIKHCLHPLLITLCPCEGREADKFLTKSHGWTPVNVSAHLFPVLSLVTLFGLNTRRLKSWSVFTHYALFAAATAYFCKRRHLTHLGQIAKTVSTLRLTNRALDRLRLNKFKNLQTLEITNCTAITEPFLQSLPHRVPMMILRNQPPPRTVAHILPHTDQLCVIDPVNVYPRLTICYLPDTGGYTRETIEAIPQDVTWVCPQVISDHYANLAPYMPAHVTTLLFADTATGTQISEIVRVMPESITDIVIPYFITIPRTILAARAALLRIHIR